MRKEAKQRLHDIYLDLQAPPPPPPRPPSAAHAQAVSRQGNERFVDLAARTAATAALCCTRARGAAMARSIRSIRFDSSVACGAQICGWEPQAPVRMGWLGGTVGGFGVRTSLLQEERKLLKEENVDLQRRLAAHFVSKKSDEQVGTRAEPTAACPPTQ